jgi:nicotinate-nucleotide adenylyltransferase
LEALKAQYPDAELCLLMGMDSYRTLDRWKRPERIRELARVAVLARGGNDDQAASPGVTVVTTRRIDVSASEIRARVAAGKSIRGFVAESVERYISAAELYRAAASR